MLVRVRDSVTAPLGHLVSWEWDNVHYVNTDNDRKEERHIFKLSNSENKCSPFCLCLAHPPAPKTVGSSQ